MKQNAVHPISEGGLPHKNCIAWNKNILFGIAFLLGVGDMEETCIVDSKMIM
jgi:hypothetical protein